METKQTHDSFEISDKDMVYTARRPNKATVSATVSLRQPVLVN